MMRDAHKHVPSFITDAPRTSRLDPTRTLRIRKRMRAELAQRWRAVKRIVTQGIVAQDLFGLSTISAGSILSVAYNSGRMPGFATGDKVASFQRWFDEVLLQLVMVRDGVWLEQHIRSGYMAGLRHAEDLTKTRSAPDEQRLSTIVRLAIVELQGICEAVSQRAVREVAEATLKRSKLAQLARLIHAAVDKIGVVRSNAMAEALIVRSHSEASLDAFQASGITSVGTIPEAFAKPARRAARDGLVNDADEMVEVLTAGDNDVCDECEDISEGGPYEIDEARGLIPAHPWCRCAFVPADDARFAEVDKEGAANTTEEREDEE